MLWMVRNPAGQFAPELLQKSVVGLGWHLVAGHLAEARTPEDFYGAIRNAYPEYNPQQVINAGRQLYKFFHEVKAGNTVVTYDSPRRMYHIGTITGNVKINPEESAESLNFTRSVKWNHQVERDNLSQAARNSFGSTLTIFKPSEEAEVELRALMENPVPALQPETVPAAHTEVEDPFASALENSRELIKDKLKGTSNNDVFFVGLIAGAARR